MVVLVRGSSRIWQYRACCALALALGVALMPTAAHAILAARPPDAVLRGIATRADQVVVADAVAARGAELPDSSAYHPHGTLVWTETRAVVRQSWVGAARPGDTLSVWTPGGAIPGGMGMIVEDSAELKRGARYVLFLNRWRGRLVVCGAVYGALPVRNGHVKGFITQGHGSLGWLHGRVNAARRQAAFTRPTPPE